MRKNTAIGYAVFVIGLLVAPLIASAVSIPFWGPLVSCTGLGCTSVCDLVATFANVAYFGLTLAIFVAAPIIFAWGGFVFLTSGGSSSKMQNGKKILTGAVVGILLSLFSYLIVNTFIQFFVQPGFIQGFGTAFSCSAPTGSPSGGSLNSGGGTGGTGGGTGGGGGGGTGGAGGAVTCPDGSTCQAGQTCQQTGSGGGGSPVTCNDGSTCQAGQTCVVSGVDMVTGDTTYSCSGTPSSGGAYTCAGTPSGGTTVWQCPGNDSCYWANDGQTQASCSAACGTTCNSCPSDSCSDGTDCTGGGSGSGAGVWQCPTNKSCYWANDGQTQASCNSSCGTSCTSCPNNSCSDGTSCTGGSGGGGGGGTVTCNDGSTCQSPLQCQQGGVDVVTGDPIYSCVGPCNNSNPSGYCSPSNFKCQGTFNQSAGTYTFSCQDPNACSNSNQSGSCPNPATQSCLPDTTGNYSCVTICTTNTPTGACPVFQSCQSNSTGNYSCQFPCSNTNPSGYCSTSGQSCQSTNGTFGCVYPCNATNPNGWCAAPATCQPNSSGSNSCQ